MIFENRRQAGKMLAEKLSEYKGRSDVLILSIPRGGVVVGAEIARDLNLPMDVVVTKKIGAPNNPELAIGAMAEDGEAIFDRSLVGKLNVDNRYLKSEAERVRKEKVRTYIEKFRRGKELEVDGKVVIVTDDGVATGSTMEAALVWLKSKDPKEVVLAIPTGAKDSMESLERMTDKTVVLDKPRWFAAVGQFYREFEQVEDEEVKRILEAN